MLDDELSDAPSRSATLSMTRRVIMHAGPGSARDPPAASTAFGRSTHKEVGGVRSPIRWTVLIGALFFYDAATGAKLGHWTLPRPQSATENCTIHNYNIVPLRSGRYVAVSGNYQAGIWVTDFTDPASPVTVAWSDPPPLLPRSSVVRGRRTGTTTSPWSPRSPKASTSSRSATRAWQGCSSWAT